MEVKEFKEVIDRLARREVKRRYLGMIEIKWQLSISIVP